MFIIIRYSSDEVNQLREVMCYCKRVGLSPPSLISFTVIGEPIFVMCVEVATDEYVGRRMQLAVDVTTAIISFWQFKTILLSD